MGLKEIDEKINEAREKEYPVLRDIVKQQEGYIGVSWIQRRFKMGYAQASYHLDKLIADGIIKKSNADSFSFEVVKPG